MALTKLEETFAFDKSGLDIFLKFVMMTRQDRGLYDWPRLLTLHVNMSKMKRGQDLNFEVVKGLLKRTLHLQLINFSAKQQPERPAIRQHMKQEVFSNCIFNVVFFLQWVTSLVSVNHLLLVLNSSFNFLIYLSFCGTGSRRRRNREYKWNNILYKTLQSMMNDKLSQQRFCLRLYVRI